MGLIRRDEEHRAGSALYHRVSQRVGLHRIALRLTQIYSERHERRITDEIRFRKNICDCSMGKSRVCSKARVRDRPACFARTKRPLRPPVRCDSAGLPTASDPPAKTIWVSGVDGRLAK